LSVYLSVPVAAFLEMLAKSVNLRATAATVLDVFGMGWIIKRPSRGVAAEMLPKMTHDPTYSSWTLRGLLQTRFLKLRTF